MSSTNLEGDMGELSRAVTKKKADLRFHWMEGQDEESLDWLAEIDDIEIEEPDPELEAELRLIAQAEDDDEAIACPICWLDLGMSLINMLGPISNWPDDEVVIFLRINGRRETEVVVWMGASDALAYWDDEIDIEELADELAEVA